MLTKAGFAAVSRDFMKAGSLFRGAWGSTGEHFDPHALCNFLGMHFQGHTYMEKMQFFIFHP